jgi:hypothetical protein
MKRRSYKFLMLPTLKQALAASRLADWLDS